MDYKIKTIEQLKPVLIGFRKARGMMQKDMAKMLGITQQSYAKLESNPASASVARLMPVLRILGVELVLSEISPAGKEKASPVVVTPIIKREPIVSGVGRVIVRSRTGMVLKRSRGPKKSAEKVKNPTPSNAHLAEKW